MTADATRRAVRDIRARSFRGDLARSQVGVELGHHLHSATTNDVGTHPAPVEIVKALREEAGDAVS